MGVRFPSKVHKNSNGICKKMTRICNIHKGKFKNFIEKLELRNDKIELSDIEDKLEKDLFYIVVDWNTYSKYFKINK
jgi:hypothetical protein